VITVQIPAAIRMCSPVMFLGHPGVVVAADTRAPADRMGEWIVQWSDDGPDEYMAFCGSTVSVASADLALIISDPTGAAHLAWWMLYRTIWTMDEHTARIDAMGWTLAGYQAAVDCAARGLPADIEQLRDYALRVVSHG